MGHAVVVSQGAELRVHVTDALRGAVAGAYDGRDRLGPSWPLPKGWEPNAEHEPESWYKRVRFATQWPEADHPKYMDKVRVTIVHQIASGFATPTLSEFALLCDEAARFLPAVDVDVEPKDLELAVAVDAVLAPLQGAIERFRASASDDQPLAAVPPWGLALRRRGLVDQGRLYVLWTPQVPQFPEQTGTKSWQTALLEGSRHGMTERHLHAQEKSLALSKQVQGGNSNTPVA